MLGICIEDGHHDGDQRPNRNTLQALEGLSDRSGFTQFHPIFEVGILYVLSF